VCYKYLLLPFCLPFVTFAKEKGTFALGCFSFVCAKLAFLFGKTNFLQNFFAK